MALAWVSNATANNNTGSAVTGSLGTTAANQLIVITISDDSAGATAVTSVTDSKGNTYTKVPFTDTGFTSNVGLNSSSTQMWYCVTVNFGASHTVTVTWSTAATGRVAVGASYFNGFTSTPTLDKFKGAIGGSSTTPNSGASGTTATADQVVVAGYGHAGATSAFTAGSGYTNQATINVANAAVGQASKIVSATAAMTATATIAAGRLWGCLVATFRDGAGGGGGSTGQAKVYNGSSFVAKPVKAYNGSSFVTKPLKIWNGSAWVATTY